MFSLLRRARLGLGLGLMCCTVLGIDMTARADENKIKVQLFGTEDLGDFDGCRFALWQKGRTPGKDKFAYVFFMPYGGDGAPLPAWIKTDGKIYELEQLALSNNQVDRVARHSFYKDASSKTTAHVEVFKAHDAGDVTRIDAADITIFRNGKHPFRVNAVGEMGCPKQASNSNGSNSRPAAYSVSDAITLGREQPFEGLKTIPRPVRRAIRSRLSDTCDLDSAPPFGARYAISDALTLWELPCFSGAYQGASVYAVVTNSNPDYFVLLPLPQPPVLESDEKFAAMLPKLDPSTGILATTEVSRGTGDCGTHVLYQLIATEGEVVEFKILQYREKLDCDGKGEDPSTWPIAWEAP